MIEILPAPTHVAAFRLSGRLTAEDYKLITDEVDAKLKTHEHVGLYTEAHELSGITPSALAKDLAYGLGRLGEYHRFPRGAVVTDKPWLRAITTLSNSVVRTTEVRTFGLGERVAAMSWVAEVHDDPHKPALRIFPTTRANTVAFAWDGTVSTAEAAEVMRACERALERSEHIRMFARIDKLSGITPGAFMQSGLAKLKWRLRHKIERYAIVGGPSWLPRWVATLRDWTGIDLRHFDISDERSAWAWLEAEPVAFEGQKD
jgi:hypothetical protein